MSMNSSKNASVVLHTPESSFDLYGKAVRGELPEGATPFAACRIGPTCEHDTVIGYLFYGSAFTRETDLSRNLQTLCSWKGAQLSILAQSEENGNARDGYICKGMATKNEYLSGNNQSRTGPRLAQRE